MDFLRVDPWRVAGLWLSLGSLAWYLAVQAGWFTRRLPVRRGQAGALALWVFVQGATYVALVNLLVPRLGQ